MQIIFLSHAGDDLERKTLPRSMVEIKKRNSMRFFRPASIGERERKCFVSRRYYQLASVSMNFTCNLQRS